MVSLLIIKQKRALPLRNTMRVAVWLFICLPLLLTGCFTGVESTQRITEKDVKKVYEISPDSPMPDILAPYRDSIQAWQEGKKFLVTDPNVSLIFEHEGPLPDHIVGDTVVYQGYVTRADLSGRPTVVLNFAAGSNSLSYDTGKAIDAIDSSFAVPLLIDLDMVSHYASCLVGRKFWVLTSQWLACDGTGYRGAPRRYVPVTIISVEPGNKVLPLSVVFALNDGGERAKVMLSAESHEALSRSFGKLFSIDDPRRRYHDIAENVWQKITHCEVAEGMTKDECRLSLGAPQVVRQRPDQNGLRETWGYDNGTSLNFADGVLVSFRK